MKQIILGITVFLVACTGALAAGPSPGEVERSVLAFANDASEQKIKLSAFKKTDGLLQQDRTYMADFSVQIEFTECGSWKPGGKFEYRTAGVRQMSFQLDPPFQGCPPVGQLGRWDETLIAYKVGKGYTTAIEGQALYVEKESGWKLVEAWLLMKKNGNAPSVAVSPTVSVSTAIVVPQIVATSTLPSPADRIVGQWSGIVGKGLLQSSINLRLQQAAVGEVIGTSMYGGDPNCAGTITLRESAEDAFVLEENMTKRNILCPSGGTIKMLVQAAGTASVEWNRDGKMTMKGTVTKK